MTSTYHKDVTAMEFRRLSIADLPSLLESYRQLDGDDVQPAFAQERHCYKVILQSGTARTEAHRFYEHMGFNGSSKKAFDMRLTN